MPRTLAGMETSLSPSPATGVQGGVRWLLRAEGLAIFILACSAYTYWSSLGWGWFALLFLLPDLAFIGYAAGARWGALCYNATHATLGPAALLAWSVWQGDDLTLSLTFICWAHIGFDRALGYGLKYTQGFAFTHLGRIGKSSA